MAVCASWSRLDSCSLNDGRPFDMRHDTVICAGLYAADGHTALSLSNSTGIYATSRGQYTNCCKRVKICFVLLAAPLELGPAMSSFCLYASAMTATQASTSLRLPLSC